MLAQEVSRPNVVAGIGDHLTAVVAIVLGVAGCLEASRIRETVRPTSPSFGVVGPDGYLFAVAGALVVGGIFFSAGRFLSGLRAPRRSPADDSPTRALVAELVDGGVVEQEPVSTQGRGDVARIAVLGALLALYVYGITTLGYAVSTLLFIAFAAKASGFKSWWRVVPFAVAVTVFAYFLFVYEAQLPLPKGYLF